MKRHSTSWPRCSATIRTHLLVIQANGHTGSNQNRTCGSAAVSLMPPPCQPAGRPGHHLSVAAA